MIVINDNINGIFKKNKQSIRKKIGGFVLLVIISIFSYSVIYLLYINDIDYWPFTLILFVIGSFLICSSLLLKSFLMLFKKTGLYLKGFLIKENIIEIGHMYIHPNNIENKNRYDVIKKGEWKQKKVLILDQCKICLNVIYKASELKDKDYLAINEIAIHRDNKKIYSLFNVIFKDSFCVIDNSKIIYLKQYYNEFDEIFISYLKQIAKIFYQQNNSLEKVISAVFLYSIPENAFSAAFLELITKENISEEIYKNKQIKLLRTLLDSEFQKCFKLLIHKYKWDIIILGKNIEDKYKCPNCNNFIDGEDDYCPNCNEKLFNCPVCKGIINGEVRICNHCGVELDY